MVSKLNFSKKLVGKIAVPLVVLLFVVILVCKYDFYYALNDDTGIRDLLSGNYSGRPEAHCMQLLYPLALLYTGLYSMIPGMPWFGLSLMVFQMLALIGIAKLITEAVCESGKEVSDNKETCDKAKYVKHIKRYLIIAVLVVAAIMAVTLKEMVFVQYTVCSAIVCIFVIADILLSKEGKEKLILDGICCLYAIGLREEMGLLMLPFIGLAVFLKCNLSFKKVFSKKWLIFMSSVAICSSLLFIADGLAYSGEWGKFRQFFNARTLVYDYTGIPDFKENIDFYNSNNISKEQYELLKSYNFSLDEAIDVRMLESIGQYAKEMDNRSIFNKLYKAAYTYIYDFMHGWELGFSLLIWVGYIFLYRLSFYKRDWRLFIKTSLVLGLRTTIWVYMYSLGRQGGLADRITHPLFFVELILIFGLLITDNIQRRWKFATTFCIISMYVCLLLVFSIGQVKAVDQEYERRENSLVEWESFQAAVSEAEGFYYIDVYSTVKYSEKIFSRNQENIRNYEIAGGWISKSPAFYEKANMYGFKNPENGIESGKAHFLRNIGEIENFTLDKVQK